MGKTAAAFLKSAAQQQNADLAARGTHQEMAALELLDERIHHLKAAFIRWFDYRIFLEIGWCVLFFPHIRVVHLGQVGSYVR